MMMMLLLCYHLFVYCCYCVVAFTICLVHYHIMTIMCATHCFNFNSSLHDIPHSILAIIRLWLITGMIEFYLPIHQAINTNDNLKTTKHLLIYSNYGIAYYFILIMC